MTTQSSTSGKQPRITIERTFPDAPEDVWAMWATREGLESWWGPDGFTATVHELDLRAGGRLEIVMRATNPDVIAWLESVGQATANSQAITYTEVAPVTRLAFVERFAYAPEVEPYDVEVAVALAPVPEGTKLTLTCDALHDEQWSQLAVAGWNSSLDKLGQALARVPGH